MPRTYQTFASVQYEDSVQTIGIGYTGIETKAHTNEGKTLKRTEGQ